MNVILGLLARHALTIIGGYLAAKGASVTDVQTVIGALTTIAGIGWSYYQKHASGVLDAAK
jgi:hypothetical protein